MHIYSDPHRNYTIRVRVNEDEYNAFKVQSQKLGYKTISDFIRSLIKKEHNNKGQK